MFILKATQKVSLSIAVQDAEGNAAKVDGAPVWSVSDPAVGELTVAEDGMSATLAGGSPSTGQVNVKVDADLGEGSTEIVGVLDVEIVAGDASVVTINPGTPEPQ